MQHSNNMQPLQPLDIADQLTQLHDNSLRELFDVIDNHKSALHDLVQQAQAELTALVGAPAATSSQQVMRACLSLHGGGNSVL